MCGLLAGAPAARAAAAEADRPATGSTNADPRATSTDRSAADSTSTDPPQGGMPTSPLAIHVGNADLLIGGFMDATVISRSTNTGNGIGTSFGTIPFSTSPAGNLTETKFSAQNSRLTLQATSKVGSANLKGYLEADFLGNAPNGLNVTSNSNTLRMRVFWAQLTSGKFEFLAGQSWSMFTPNRTGISPVPGDIFFSQDVDTNYQMGLTWGRTPGFRFLLHASDVVTAGLALENPEQYVGSAVVLPAGFPAAEVDAGTVTTTVPNAYPDIIGKIALDPKMGKTHQHLDAAVVVRGYKTYDPTSAATFSETGTGYSVNAVLEPVKQVHLIGTSYFSNGGGRYIANTNLPDFIVNNDSSVSLVKSKSFIGGVELNVGAKTLLYGYYSFAQADRNVALDTNGKPIGFGVAGSSSANHEIKEATVGLTQTFFRDPKIGAMQLMLQYANLKRTLFAAPSSTAPGDASLNMVYVNVRYVLP